jgi:hypothetical protein
VRWETTTAAYAYNGLFKHGTLLHFLKAWEVGFGLLRRPGPHSYLLYVIKACYAALLKEQKEKES